MSSTVTMTERAAQRCAFCKIDLRGRFVFANAQAEELLGASQVEIFGHPLVEFLDAGDHRIIKEIISHSSHFETSYDSAPVTLVRRDGSCLPATIILSLNFRGGTPVNYEIIITPAAPAGQQSQTSDDIDIISSVDALLDADPNHPSNELADALCRFTGASTVKFFEVRPESGAIVAESAGLSGHAARPGGEVVTVEHPLASEHPLSVQFSFASDGTPEQEERVRHTTERVVCLINRAIPSASPETTSAMADLSGPSSLDILDRIGLGALVLDQEGSVISANAVTRQLFASAVMPGTFEDVLAALSSCNDPALIERLRLLRSCAGDNSAPLTCTESVVTPNGERQRLVMGCAADGQSGYLVFDNQIAYSPASRLQPVMDYFADSLTALEASVRAVDGFCENLEHENHGELRGHGGFYLKSLRRQWNRVDETLRELHMSLDLVRKTEDSEPTDPGLILSRAFEDASARRPDDSVELRLPDLPKSMIDRSRLTAVMRSLMVHLVYATESAVQVESQITDELLRLRFIVPVTPATRARVERSWHGSAVCASDIAPVTGGRVLSLAAIKGLAAVSGGELQLKSSDQDSLVFELSFPFRAVPQDA